MLPTSLSSAVDAMPYMRCSQAGHCQPRMVRALLVTPLAPRHARLWRQLGVSAGDATLCTASRVAMEHARGVQCDECEASRGNVRSNFSDMLCTASASITPEGHARGAPENHARESRQRGTPPCKHEVVKHAMRGQCTYANAAWASTISGGGPHLEHQPHGHGHAGFVQQHCCCPQRTVRIILVLVSGLAAPLVRVLHC
jgi:hypothetical protein